MRWLKWRSTLEGSWSEGVLAAARSMADSSTEPASGVCTDGMVMFQASRLGLSAFAAEAGLTA